MSEPVPADPVAPEPAPAPAPEPAADPADAGDAAADEGEAEAEPAEFWPVVTGPNPTHTVQEAVDWILDKIGRK